MSEDEDEITIDENAPQPIVGIVIVYVLMLAAGLGLMRLVGVAPIADRNPAELGRSALLGLAIGAALVAASGALRARSRLFDALEEVVRERLRGLDGRGILLLAVLSATAEEAFFRGFLQSWLAALAGSPATGLVVTGVVFGLLHAGPITRFWPWTLFATGCGFLLGWLFLETGDLLAPVLVHFLVNAVNMARILRRPSGS